jgi:hypothetical protein
LRFRRIRNIVPATLRTVTVKLKDRVLAEIDAEARARRTTRSAVVRARLKRPAAPAGSAWDRMRDLVIGGEPAPSDLAANKAHLKGYGGRGGSRRR